MNSCIWNQVPFSRASPGHAAEAPASRGQQGRRFPSPTHLRQNCILGMPGEAKEASWGTLVVNMQPSSPGEGEWKDLEGMLGPESPGQDRLFF